MCEYAANFDRRAKRGVRIWWKMWEGTMAERYGKASRG